MKVILTKYYEKLGDAGDIVNVKDGFANNFLIPNNIVLPATRGNIKQMEIVKTSLIKKEAKNIEEAEKISEKIDGALLKFKVNSSPEGKLYGSITNMDIAEKLLEVKKTEIDRKKIDLPEHIKEVGSYDITVKLYKDVKAMIIVKVDSDEYVKPEDATADGQAEEQAQEKAVEANVPEAVTDDAAVEDPAAEKDEK